MKNILRSCAVLLIASSFTTGCEAPTNDVDNTPKFQMGNPHGGGGGTSTPANPELCYTSKITSKGKMYYTLAVMDVDGSHPTTIYQAPKPSPMILYGSPTWSADGGSIVFTQSGGGGSDTIKAIDVSVNSSGQAVGSNVRVIAIAPTGVGYKNAFWSSAGSGLIAFTSNETNSNSLWTVSASGGTPTKIMSIDKTWSGSANPLGMPTWNGDDSRLALIRMGASNTTIMIYNTSTWAYEDSIVVPGTVNGLEWSRSGMNKLAYSTNNQIYYVDPVTGATPTTNNVTGGFPAWAPDNSSLMYTASTTPGGSGEVRNNTAFSATTSLISTTSVAAVKWK